MDRITIRNLRARCIVGIFPEERTQKQDVILNIVLHADLAKPCKTDDIDDTIDYKKVKKEVLSAVEASSYNLVERLAEHVAEITLNNPNVQRAEVSIDKPAPGEVLLKTEDSRRRSSVRLPERAFVRRVPDLTHVCCQKRPRESRYDLASRGCWDSQHHFPDEAPNQLWTMAIAGGVSSLAAARGTMKTSPPSVTS